jgi:predicted methyltransferase
MLVESYKLIRGDSCEVLKTLASESIDLTVTSPPYDNLRQYQGFVFDFEGIARELFRVTKQGGVVVWVVGKGVGRRRQSMGFVYRYGEAYRRARAGNHGKRS